MVLDAILKRRSVREYKSDMISDKDLQEILKAAQYAPTARNNKSVEFVVVTNKEKKDELYAFLGQEFVKKAPVLIVPTIDPKCSLEPMQDISVATQNIFIQAASLGLGTVWKNINSENSEKVKKLLGIPKNNLVINLVPVGYPDETLKSHDEKEFDKNKVHHEKW